METFRSLVSSYIRELTVQGFRSIVHLQFSLKVYERWLTETDLCVHEITSSHAEEYQTYLVTLPNSTGKPKHTKKTVAMYVWGAKRFHEWLRSMSLVATNPFKTIPRIRIGQQIPRDIPSEKDLCESLYTLAHFWKKSYVRDKRTLYRVHVMAEVLYATGMRIAELGALKPEDCNTSDRTIVIRDGKGGVARLAYLSEYSAHILDIYMRTMRIAVSHRIELETLFNTRNGNCIASQLNKHLRHYVGFTSHGFRHALGSHLLRAGCDMRMIQLILGHEDLKSTAIYAKVVKEDLRDQLDRYHPRSGSES